MLYTGEIFSLKIRIDSCYCIGSLGTDQILLKPWKKQKRTYLSFFIHYSVSLLESQVVDLLTRVIAPVARQLCQGQGLHVLAGEEGWP